MNGHSEAIHNIIDSHFVSAFFMINIIEYAAGKVVLKLDTRAEHLTSQGALGCIMDCVARVAGYESIGACVVTEYELNSCSHSPAARIIASARIDTASTDFAIYSCNIDSVDNQVSRPLARSHGSLLKISDNNEESLKKLSGLDGKRFLEVS